VKDQKLHEQKKHQGKKAEKERANMPFKQIELYFILPEIQWGKF